MKAPFNLTLRNIAFMLILLPFLVFVSGIAPAQEKKFVASVDTDGVQRIEVLAGQYFFEPNYIIVKADVPVEITIRKEPSIIPHDFVLNAPEAGVDILTSLSTEPKTIKFVPLKPGKYTFYCDKKLLFFKSHRNQGMEGILEVTK